MLSEGLSHAVALQVDTRQAVNSEASMGTELFSGNGLFPEESGSKVKPS